LLTNGALTFFDVPGVTNNVRWIKRIGITLGLLIVALVVAVSLFGPAVNIPLGGMLANVFPDLFEIPSTDSETVDRELEVREGYGLSLFAAEFVDRTNVPDPTFVFSKDG
jgi:hypothetical protein